MLTGLKADGRDSDVSMMQGPSRISREVYVPQLENGSLQYIIMEIIAASDADSGWAVKELQPQPSFPNATGPSAVSYPAMDGVQSSMVSQSGLQAVAAGAGWTA